MGCSEDLWGPVRACSNLQLSLSRRCSLQTIQISWLAFRRRPRSLVLVHQASKCLLPDIPPVVPMQGLCSLLFTELLTCRAEHLLVFLRKLLLHLSLLVWVRSAPWHSLFPRVCCDPHHAVSCLCSDFCPCPSLACKLLGQVFMRLVSEAAPPAQAFQLVGRKKRPSQTEE